MRAMHGVLLAVWLGGCAMSHRLADDAATSCDAAVGVDAGVSDGAARDAGSSTVDAGEVVRCGPNVCRGEEICCNEACGVCAFADECVDHGCL